MSTANPNTLHQIAIAGASGRMGRMLIEAVRNASDAKLAGALDIAASPAVGADATAFMGVTSEVQIASDLREGLKNARYLIDFTRPEGTMAHLRVCRELGVKMVIGTTGFTEAQIAEIEDDVAQHGSRRQRGVQAVGAGRQDAQGRL
jgi:4-hydroxy-tetrahydrodipicolinate reductase